MEEVLDYEGLIYSIINKYPNRYDKEDLFQVGMLGLIDAYKHYDKNHETKFSTFAYYYIIGEVNKYIRESSSLKISKNYIELKKKIIKTKELMTQKLGRNPTKQELALYLEVEEELIDEAILATDEVDSLENSTLEFGKTYDNTSAEVMDLKNEIENLPQAEKELIIARYYTEMTQKEASDVLGLSQSQVSRTEAKVLKKLKERLVA